MKKHKEKLRNIGPDKGSCPDHLELNTVVSLFTERRYPEAEAMARTMTAHFPRFGFGWTVLGAVLMKMERFADALAPMEKAAGLSPDNHHVHNSLGMTLRLFGRLDEAENCFRRAIQIKPNDAEAHNNLGITYLDRSRLNVAESCFLCALHLRPDYAEAHNNLGLTLRNLGRLDEATASFSHALRFNQESAEICNTLGLALYGKGEGVDAEKYFQFGNIVVNDAGLIYLPVAESAYTGYALLRYSSDNLFESAIDFSSESSDGCQADPDRGNPLFTELYIFGRI